MPKLIEKFEARNRKSGAIKVCEVSTWVERYGDETPRYAIVGSTLSEATKERFDSLWERI